MRAKEPVLTKLGGPQWAAAVSRTDHKKSPAYQAEGTSSFGPRLYWVGKWMTKCRIISGLVVHLLKVSWSWMTQWDTELQSKSTTEWLQMKKIHLRAQVDLRPENDPRRAAHSGRPENTTELKLLQQERCLLLTSVQLWGSCRFNHSLNVNFHWTSPAALWVDNERVRH